MVARLLDDGPAAPRDASTIVNPIDAVGRSRGATTKPAAPLTDRRPSEAGTGRQIPELAEPGVGAADLLRGVARQLAALDAQDDVGIEQLEQRLEVASASRAEERIHPFALASEVRFGLGRRSADPAPGAARQLPGGLGRAADDRRDLGEGTPNMS